MGQCLCVWTLQSLVVEVRFVQALRFETFGPLIFYRIELSQRKVIKILLCPPNLGVPKNRHGCLRYCIFVLRSPNVVLEKK